MPNHPMYSSDIKAQVTEWIKNNEAEVFFIMMYKNLQMAS